MRWGGEKGLRGERIVEHMCYESRVRGVLAVKAFRTEVGWRDGRGEAGDGLINTKDV